MSTIKTASQAEIDHDDAALAVDQHVRWLEIAVYEARVVQSLKAARKLQKRSDRAREDALARLSQRALLA
jgi:hypothetical protein